MRAAQEAENAVIEWFSTNAVQPENAARLRLRKRLRLLLPQRMCHPAQRRVRPAQRRVLPTRRGHGLRRRSSADDCVQQWPATKV